MPTFSQMYKPYTFGGGRGVCENQANFNTLSTFWPDFYYFHGDAWYSKDIDVYSFFWGGGRGLKTCMVCRPMKMLTFMEAPK